MSLIIAPIFVPVKSSSLDLLPLSLIVPGAVAAAFAPEPIPAEHALADRLAWLADDGDPDAYPGPGWNDPALEAPTAAESAEWLGFLLGADGVIAEYLSPDAAERRAFERGHDAGDHYLWTVDPLFAAHLAAQAERAGFADAVSTSDQPPDWADAELVETAGDRRFVA